MNFKKIRSAFLIAASALSLPIHADEASRSNWHQMYFSVEDSAINSQLSQLQSRYVAVRNPADKLFISSLIHDLMSRQKQPYHGSAYWESKSYKQIEETFISALNLESQNNYDAAFQTLSLLRQKLKVEGKVESKAVVDYQLCKLANKQTHYYQGQFYCSSLHIYLSNTQQPVLPAFKGYRVIANNQFFLSDYANALETYLLAIDRTPINNDISGLYNDIGNLLREMSEFDRSEKYLKDALELRLKLENKLLRGQTHHSLGSLYLAWGKPSLALAQFTQAEKEFKQLNHKYGLTRSYIGIAKSYSDLDKHEISNSYLLQALDSNESKNNGIESEVYLTLSRSYGSKEMYDLAETNATNALYASIETGRKTHQAQAYLQLSKIAEARLDYERAYTFHKQYTDIELDKIEQYHRDTFDSLELSKAQYEQELRLSQLANTNLEQQNQLKNLEKRNLMYNSALITLLLVVAAFCISHARTKRKAEKDSLTGVLNRATAIETLREKGDTHSVSHKNVVALLDLDNFKQINDDYGHPTGDAVLCNVVDALQQSIGKDGFIGRLGGEEFIVYMSQVDEIEVYAKVEALRAAIKGKKTQAEDGRNVSISASFSFLATSESLYHFDEYYSILDQALYQAKQNGRDCLVDAYNDPIDLPSSAFLRETG